MASISVPGSRVARWVANFEARHGETVLSTTAGALVGRGEDGSTFRARLPFDQLYDGPASTEAFVAALALPDQWGILLVRKGGFAVARLERDRIVESKVGQRHVQGRTKAGGQSQQRFARRRDNQARQAYEAAADHAARILALDKPDLRGLSLVTGGDHPAIDEVLTDPRLRGLIVVEPWLAVPDPKRGVLDQATQDAAAVRIDVVNAPN